jgi:uncharacterized protein YndB with AHSA1/START domain
MTSAVLTTPTDTQILMTREFDAPAALVWRAYTEPELVARWWPGRRGTMQLCEIDLRVGGTWRYVMTTSEGFEVAFHGEYQEIEDGERIVNTEVYEAVGGPGIVVTTTFEAQGDRCVLHMLSECGSQEVRDMILGSGMESGAQEGFDILEQIARELGALRA